MSTRNFDHRAIVQRIHAMNHAQSHYRYAAAGKNPIHNPQTADGSAHLVSSYREGVEATYSRGLLGNTTQLSTDSGIANVVYEQLHPELFFVAPLPPYYLLAPQRTASSITISFLEGDPGTDGAVLNYAYSTNGGTSFTVCSPAMTTSPLLITGLSPSTLYGITLKAITATTQSIASSILLVQTLGLPSAPTITSITPGNTQLVLQFTAPTSTGGSPITNYAYSLNNGATFTLMGQTTTAPYTVTGLTQTTTYQVVIRAVTALGNGAASSTVSATTTGGVPDAPTPTGALVGSGVAYLYFDLAGTGYAATSIEYSTNAGSSWTTMGTTVSPFYLTGLTNGVAYTVIVRAVNGSGASNASTGAVTFTPVNPGAVGAQLYYDANNSSCYSGTGTTINNVGFGGVLAGTMTSGVGYVTGTGLSTKKVFDFNPDDGTDYISFGSYDFGSQFTVMAWVYVRDRNNINGFLTNTVANQSPSGFKLGWNTWNADNKAMLYEGGNGSTGSSTASVASTMVDNSWQHVTYIVDVTNRRVYFFRNGVACAYMNTNLIQANIGTNQAFRIGSFMDGSYAMNAQVGYMKAFTGILNVSTIQSEFNATKAVYGL